MSIASVVALIVVHLLRIGGAPDGDGVVPPPPPDGPAVAGLPHAG